MIQHLGGGRTKDHGPQRPHAGARAMVSGVGLGNVVVAPYKLFTQRMLSPEQRERDRARKQRRRDALRGHTCARCKETYGPEAFYAKKDGSPMSYCRSCWGDYNREAHARRRAAR